jgi:hypothetical protein
MVNDVFSLGNPSVETNGGKDRALLHHRDGRTADDALPGYDFRGFPTEGRVVARLGGVDRCY